MILKFVQKISLEREQWEEKVVGLKWDKSEDWDELHQQEQILKAKVWVFSRRVSSSEPLGGSQTKEQYERWGKTSDL